MGTPRSERPDASAPRGRFETLCWFVAASVSAVGLIGGVAAAGASGLFAATVSAVNLVALADRALHRRFSWLVWAWSLVVALASPLALVSAILLCDSLVAGAEAAWISGLDRILLLVAIVFPASFVALRGRDAFRPAWWHALLFLVPFLGFSVLLASGRALRWFGELLHGPKPDDFLGAMEWHHEVGDSTEGIVAWTLLTWVAFFLAGAIRGAIVSRPSEPPPTRLGPPDAVSGSARRTRVGVVAWWIALVLAVAGAMDASLRWVGGASDAGSEGLANAWTSGATFWVLLLVALAAARRSAGFHWLRYLWSLLVVAALPLAAIALFEIGRRAGGGEIEPGAWSLEGFALWRLVPVGVGLPAAAFALRAGEAFRPSWRQSVLFLMPLAWCFVVATRRDVAWRIDAWFFSASWDGHLPHWASSTDAGPYAAAWFVVLWLAYFLLGTGRSIVLRRPIEDPRFGAGLGRRTDGSAEPTGA